MQIKYKKNDSQNDASSTNRLKIGNVSRERNIQK